MATGFSDAGYANRRDTGYRAGDRIGGPGVGGQMQANRQAQIRDLARRVGAGTTQIGNSGRTEAGLTQDALMGMQRDYNNEGNSGLENFGNFGAGLLGFHEQRPTALSALDRVRSTVNPTANGLDTRASWGFDPIGALAGIGGLALGVPALGVPAGMISRALDYPLDIELGPDVFGGTPSGISAGGTGVSEPGGTGISEPGGQRGNTIGESFDYPSPLSASQARSLSYLTGRPINAGSPGGAANVPAGTTGDIVSDLAGTPDFGGPAVSIAASRSPFNNRIGGLTAGGFALGDAKRRARPASLAEGLGRYGDDRSGRLPGFI